MLVLTRGEGQSVLIGDDIRVTIVGTRSRQVRIAIDAPPEIRVLREEIAGNNAHGAPVARGSDRRK